MTERYARVKVPRDLGWTWAVLPSICGSGISLLCRPVGWLVLCVCLVITHMGNIVLVDVCPLPGGAGYWGQAHCGAADAPPPRPFTPMVTHSRIFHLMRACLRCITASWCLTSDLFLVQYVQALPLHWCHSFPTRGRPMRGTIGALLQVAMCVSYVCCRWRCRPLPVVVNRYWAICCYNRRYLFV